MRWQSESEYWQQGLAQKQRGQETDLTLRLSRRAFEVVFVLEAEETEGEGCLGMTVVAMEVGAVEVGVGERHLVLCYVASLAEMKSLASQQVVP